MFHFNHLIVLIICVDVSNKQTNPELFTCRENLCVSLHEHLVWCCNCYQQLLWFQIHEDLSGITTPPQSPQDGSEFIGPTSNYQRSKASQHAAHSATSTFQPTVSSLSTTAQCQPQQDKPLPSNKNSSTVYKCIFYTITHY